VQTQESKDKVNFKERDPDFKSRDEDVNVTRILFEQMDALRDEVEFLKSKRKPRRESVDPRAGPRFNYRRSSIGHYDVDNEDEDVEDEYYVPDAYLQSIQKTPRRESVTSKGDSQFWVGFDAILGRDKGLSKESQISNDMYETLLTRKALISIITTRERLLKIYKEKMKLLNKDSKK
jgi:hypothetical protein